MSDWPEVFAGPGLEVDPQLVLGVGVHEEEGLDAGVVEVVSVDRHLPALHAQARDGVRPCNITITQTS